MKKNEGQATLEFLASIIFGLAFFFVHIKLGLNTTVGYLVHYATFAGSRVYLTHEGNDLDPRITYQAAENKARSIFGLFKLDLFGIKPEDFKINHLDSVGAYEYVGAFATFSQLLSTSSIIGGRKQLDFRSESFLGREPSKSECLQQICKAFSKVTGDSGCDNPHITAFDDGC